MLALRDLFGIAIEVWTVPSTMEVVSSDGLVEVASVHENNNNNENGVMKMVHARRDLLAHSHNFTLSLWLCWTIVTHQLPARLCPCCIV